MNNVLGRCCSYASRSKGRVLPFTTEASPEAMSFKLLPLAAV